MIQDIVFEQNYAKKVNAHTQQVAQQAFMGGRQQGWNEVLYIVGKLQEEDKEITPENIVEELKIMLQAGEHAESKSPEPTSSEKKKPTLSIVK